MYASFGRLLMTFLVIRWEKISILIIIFLPLTMQQIAFTSEYYLRDKKDECDFLSVSTFICRSLILESELHHNTSMAWSVHFICTCSKSSGFNNDLRMS